MASNALSVSIKDLKALLSKQPDYLRTREVKAIWDDIAKCVTKKNAVNESSFEKLENAIQAAHNKKVKDNLLQNKVYKRLKTSIIQVCESKNNMENNSDGAMAVKVKTVINVQNSKQTSQPLPQKDDSSASMAFARVCQLIEWLNGVLEDRADGQIQDKQDCMLEEEHIVPYNTAERQIFEIRLKFKQLTDTLPKGAASSSKQETATTEQPTHSTQRYIEHERQAEDNIQVHPNDRKHYEAFMQDLKEQYDQHMWDMKDKIKTLQKEVHSLKEEKEGLMTRMSKMAGDKLTHNNPAITDLSDPNRPQKLGEKYGELYDNEWTDAIDKLNTKKEENHDRSCIDTLLAILQFCYRECEKTADNHLSQLETVCCSLQINNKQQKQLPDGSEAIKRNLLDAQHGASILTRTAAVDIVKGSLSRHTPLKDKAKKVLPYTEKCIEICWSMVTHHPRLVLLWPEDSKEKPIRYDMFQAYTRSGGTLDFVVWPAMLLHKDGPLLKKGTVQPIAK